MVSRLSLILLAVPLCLGCGYGEVSPTAYEYSKALYSISNRKLEGRLDAVRHHNEVSHESGELTIQEANWLTSIVEDAKNKQWNDAMNSARRMMEDQVAKK
ncbi:MAG: hypothetical protein KDB27_23150 [Planctomycetales bacterium]|nr:hypothetical protein [Planctomycetales bacterium]